MLQSFDERSRAIEIAIIEIVGSVVGVKVPFEDRDLRSGWIAGIPSIGDKLTERKIGLARFLAFAPKVPTARLPDLRGTLCGIGEFSTALTVSQWPRLLDEIGCVRRHRPFVAISAHLTIDIKVVEHNELIDERMMVRGDVLSEDAESRIAVPFGHVTEQLIVGSVFFDDVDAMLDRTRIANLRGNRIVRGSLSVDNCGILTQRCTLKGQPSHLCEFIRGRCWDRGQGSLKEPADVLSDVFRRGLQRIGSIAVIFAR